ncbi:MAG: hypothetical protein C0478_17255 [Planctomyces sp.]|nr:hypothetical protein [Planctomyces sp.]
MTLADLFADFLANGTGRSLALLAPELIVCITIVMTLLGRLLHADRRFPTSAIAVTGTLVALVWAGWQLRESVATGQPAEILFTGMVRLDRFALFLRVYLLLFLVLQIVLTSLGGIPDREDSPDFYTLLLGAVVGLMLMTTAHHLLLVFLALEMSSVPGYVLAGFLKGRRQSSEAALKFVIFGSASAGLLLFGLTLICGIAGTGDLSLVGQRLEAAIALDGATLANPLLRTLLLALVMIFAGMAFKLSLVPFHFWCPDVFHGAAAEVGAFLSVASKGATLGLLVRLILGMVAGGELTGFWNLLAGGLGVVAAVTVTFGNLAAFGQTNIKRLMAYSTIAHAGYLLMPVAILAIPAFAGVPETVGGAVNVGVMNTGNAVPDPVALTVGVRAVEAMLYYLVVTLFMNLGVFTCVILVRNQTLGESLEDFRGLAAQAPFAAVAMAVSLASLIGLPPLGGFVAKLMVFASLYQAGAKLPIFYAVLVVGAFNTLLSLLVYLKLFKAMFLEERAEGAAVVRIPLFSTAALFLLAITIPVLSLGVDVAGMSELARGAALSLWQDSPGIATPQKEGR